MLLPLLLATTLFSELEGELPAPLSEADMFGPPAPVPGCLEQLAEAGVDFVPGRIPVHPNKSGTHLCGAEQIVRMRKAPAGMRIAGSPPMTCALALSLAKFEPILHEEAQRWFGSRVSKFVHLGTYNCREMANYPGWVSEHSYANGIDLRSIVLRNGKVLDVLGHYGDGEGPTTDRSASFMRAVAQRAYREGLFSVVITPAFDELHENHIHLDMARYRVDGTVSPEV